MFLRDLEQSLKECFLDIAFMIASSDGDYSESEKALIREYQLEMNINYEPKAQSSDYIISTLSSATNSDRKKIVFELASLAMVDDVYTDEEKEILENLAQALDIPTSFIIESFDIINGLKNLYLKSALLVSE